MAWLRTSSPLCRASKIIYPDNFGTFNWGGVAIDPDPQVVFAMPIYLAFTSTLIARTDATSRVVSKPDQPPFNENFWSALCRKDERIFVPAGPAVLGSAVGLYCRRRPDHRQDLLSSRQRHGARPVANPVTTENGSPGHRRPYAHKRRCGASQRFARLIRPDVRCHDRPAIVGKPPTCRRAGNADDILVGREPAPVRLRGRRRSWLHGDAGR